MYHKPTRSKYTTLQQICKLIPPGLVDKNAHIVLLQMNLDFSSSEDIYSFAIPRMTPFISSSAALYLYRDITRA